MNISQRITGQKNKNKTNKQAHTGLTRRILNDRIQTMNEKQLKRIADAMEEILRLVKKDMENINKAAKE